MMRRISFLLLFFFCLGVSMTFAQNSESNQKYWVFLSDKKHSSFDPHSYFDAKAIQRRHKLGINLYDSSDFPVSDIYVNSVSQIVDSISVVSRWFNAIVLHAKEDQVEKLHKLPFVDSIVAAYPLAKQISGRNNSDHSNFSLSAGQIAHAKAQIARMGVNRFKENGLTGKGMRIAIFDVGFKSYKTNSAFAHIREGNRIVSTWDFVKNRIDVDAGGSHGTNVLSCIAGREGNQWLGLAQDAEFLLARTETWTEFFSEEENWLAAAEWADKKGADIINSSLGYTYHRYFRYNMDGKTAFVSRAANMAAHKGILVVNSAGNEGANSWKNVGAPADADSVLSIGGIHPRTGIHTSFSSFGPTWDKRLKPNVCAYGHVVAAGPKGYHSTQGTSFSSPLVAGFAACAWQSDTSLTNMELFELIQRSADLYPYFDYAHGYGVPQAGYFIESEWVETEPSIEFVKDGHWLKIKLTNAADNGKPIIDESSRKTSLPPHVFYHIEKTHGSLDKYFVVTSPSRDAIKEDDSIEKSKTGPGPLTIDINEFQKPFTVRAFHKGTVIEYIVE